MGTIKLLSPSTPGGIPEMEFKSDTGINGFNVVDEEKGIVEAIVSVTGLLDRVGDVIMPGAYEKTLLSRKPKGLTDHDWKQPVSKVLEIKELLPGDPALPDKLADGSPWPSEAGALWVKAQYNLGTTQGRDAYANAKFYGNDQEWSIGYNVPAGSASKKDSVRYIKEIQLYEYSQVLWGAMPSARTVGIKADDAEHNFEAKDIEGVMANDDDDMFVAVKKDDIETITTVFKDMAKVLLESDYDEKSLAELIGISIAPAEPEEEGLGLKYGPAINEYGGVLGSDVKSVLADLGEDLFYSAYVGDDESIVTGIEDDIVKVLREQLEQKDFRETDTIRDIAAALADTVPDIKAEMKKFFSSDSRDKLAKSGAAMPDGSFPIENGRDLKSAIHLWGRASDPEAAKAHIIKRAEELGLTSDLPDGWIDDKEDSVVLEGDFLKSLQEIASLHVG